MLMPPRGHLLSPDQDGWSKGVRALEWRGSVGKCQAGSQLSGHRASSVALARAPAPPGRRGRIPAGPRRAARPLRRGRRRRRVEQDHDPLLLAEQPVAAGAAGSRAASPAGGGRKYVGDLARDGRKAEQPLRRAVAAALLACARAQQRAGRRRRTTNRLRSHIAAAAPTVAAACNGLEIRRSESNLNNCGSGRDRSGQGLVCVWKGMGGRGVGGDGGGNPLASCTSRSRPSAIQAASAVPGTAAARRRGCGRALLLSFSVRRDGDKGSEIIKNQGRARGSRTGSEGAQIGRKALADFFEVRPARVCAVPAACLLFQLENPRHSAAEPVCRSVHRDFCMPVAVRHAMECLAD